MPQVQVYMTDDDYQFVQGMPRAFKLSAFLREQLQQHKEQLRLQYTQSTIPTTESVKHGDAVN